MELIVGLVGGGIISWLLTHWYYRKANKEAPEWARVLIDRFPNRPPTIDELVDLYHQAFMAGEITPHPSGFIKCPECGTGSEKFVAWEHYARQLDSHFHGFKCGECNHELTAEED